MTSAKVFERLPTMKRVKQITLSHCGPAVMRMLFSHLNMTIFQKQIVEAAGIESRIRKYGMTVDEMARAVINLKLDVEIWSKYHATIEDLLLISKTYGYPVGVEWQGLFGEYEDDDPGHYSVVTGVDMDNDRIFIADPFWAYAGRDRRLKLSTFEGRWWDTNFVEDVDPKKKKYVMDEKLAFILTPKNVEFPELLSFVRGSEVVRSM
jgi:ABC-type bacteriocin/lantibiotic exporter with double-glycine peptidase domain